MSTSRSITGVDAAAADTPDLDALTTRVATLETTTGTPYDDTALDNRVTTLDSRVDDLEAVTPVTTSGNQSIGGTKTFTDGITVGSTFLDDTVGGVVFPGEIYVNNDTSFGGVDMRLGTLEARVTTLEAQVSPTVFDIGVAATTTTSNPKIVIQPNVFVSDPVIMTVLEVGNRRLCSLKGLIQRGTNNTNTHILTLPSGYRPSSILRFACPVFSNDGFRAIIVESSTGHVILHSNVLTGVDGNSIGNNTVAEDDKFTGLDPIQFWTS